MMNRGANSPVANTEITAVMRNFIFGILML